MAEERDVNTGTREAFDPEKARSDEPRVNKDGRFPDGSIPLPDPLEMNTLEVMNSSNRLIGNADAVARVSAALVLGARIPEDHYELNEMFENFERNRSSFDVAFGEGLRSAGTKLADAALRASEADANPPLLPYPAAAGVRGR